MGRRKKSIDERLQEPKKHIRKLTNMLKSIKDMEREGLWCEKELKDTAHKMRVIREIYKTKVKMEELKQEIKEAS